MSITLLENLWFKANRDLSRLQFDLDKARRDLKKLKENNTMGSAERLYRLDKLVNTSNYLTYYSLAIDSMFKGIETLEIEKQKFNDLMSATGDLAGELSDYKKEILEDLGLLDNLEEWELVKEMGHL